MTLTKPQIFVGAFLLDEIVGRILENGTGGDKTKIAARASEALLIVNGFSEILSGDPSDGVNQITEAVSSSSSLSPYEALAIQNLTALAAQQLALKGAIIGGTLLSQAATAIAQNVISEIQRVCTAEGGVLPSGVTTGSGNSAANQSAISAGQTSPGSAGTPLGSASAVASATPILGATAQDSPSAAASEAATPGHASMS